MNMLYLVRFELDQQALGFGEKRREIGTAEAENSRRLLASGRLMGLWRRADGGGVVYVVDAVSHEALSAELQAMPAFPYLRSIELTPLVSHPVFPDCSTVTPR
jgi:muconolactone delta-isomerase